MTPRCRRQRSLARRGRKRGNDLSHVRFTTSVQTMRCRNRTCAPPRSLACSAECAGRTIREGTLRRLMRSSSRGGLQRQKPKLARRSSRRWMRSAGSARSRERGSLDAEARSARSITAWQGKGGSLDTISGGGERSVLGRFAPGESAMKPEAALEQEEYSNSMQSMGEQHAAGTTPYRVPRQKMMYLCRTNY